MVILQVLNLIKESWIKRTELFSHVIVFCPCDAQLLPNADSRDELRCA